jgi:hypothetical protein
VCRNQLLDPSTPIFDWYQNVCPSGRSMKVATHLLLVSKVPCIPVDNSPNIPTKYIYIYITIYLPHSSYTFRCAIHHLQGGLLIFLLKTTCIPSKSYSNHMYTKYKLLTTTCIPSIRYQAFPKDGVLHNETYRRNVVNTLLYKFMCALSWYIRGDFRYIFGLFLQVTAISPCV